MGEIRFVGPCKTREYPYPVCKNESDQAIVLIICFSFTFSPKGIPPVNVITQEHLRFHAACLLVSSALFLRDYDKDSENVSLLQRSLSDGHAIQRCIIYMYIINFVNTCYNCMMISSYIF